MENPIFAKMYIPCHQFVHLFSDNDFLFRVNQYFLYLHSVAVLPFPTVHG